MSNSDSSKHSRECSLERERSPPTVEAKHEGGDKERRESGTSSSRKKRRKHRRRSSGSSDSDQHRKERHSRKEKKHHKSKKKHKHHHKHCSDHGESKQSKEVDVSRDEATSLEDKGLTLVESGAAMNERGGSGEQAMDKEGEGVEQKVGDEPNSVSVNDDQSVRERVDQMTVGVVSPVNEH